MVACAGFELKFGGITENQTLFGAASEIRTKVGWHEQESN